MPSSPCSRRRCSAPRRKLLLRLIIAEGPRFPAIAEFYYREVVSRGLQADARRWPSGRSPAASSPRTRRRAIPQLIVAPLLVSVLWDGMFSKIDPLDVGGLLRAHREVLVRQTSTGARHEHAATGAPFCWRCSRDRPGRHWPPTPICIAARPPRSSRAGSRPSCCSSPRRGRPRRDAERARGRRRWRPARRCSALDADLQRAAVAENEAAVTNARITYQRAQELLKKAVGSQKAFDDAEVDAAHGRGAAQLGQDAARPAPRGEPGRRHDPGGLLPRRRDGAGGTADRVAAAARQRQGALLRAAGGAADGAHRRSRSPCSCDGCAKDLVARVRFISAQAEFTPPVIYSQEERARLVFRVEAIPERPRDLRVGQPVTVTLQPAAGVEPCQQMTRATARWSSTSRV